MKKLSIFAFILIIAVYASAAFPATETTDEVFRVTSAETKNTPSVSNTSTSTTTRTYTAYDIEPPDGFVMVHAKTTDKETGQMISGIVMINPDAIAMIIPTEEGEVILYLSYGVGIGGRGNYTPTMSCITITESYDELTTKINNVRKSSSN